MRCKKVLFVFPQMTDIVPINGDYRKGCAGGKNPKNRGLQYNIIVCTFSAQNDNKYMTNMYKGKSVAVLVLLSSLSFSILYAEEPLPSAKPVCGDTLSVTYAGDESVLVKRSEWEALLRRVERLEVDALSGATPVEEPQREDTVKKPIPAATGMKNMFVCYPSYHLVRFLFFLFFVLVP